ncbi:MAG: folate family ECF transporter S component [Acutalibacteraceae bacterium]
MEEKVSAKHKKVLSQKNIYKLCVTALLIAMQVVLARFAAINLGPNIRFSFSFIPVVIAARLYGIPGGMCVYGLGDLVGAVAFPTTGAFFPGYTVTAFVSGLIFGAFLRKGKKEETKPAKYIKIVLSVVSSQTICSLLMNSYWRHYQTGNPYGAMLLTRLPQCLIIGALQIVFMVLFLDMITSRLDLIGKKLK